MRFTFLFFAFPMGIFLVFDYVCVMMLLDNRKNSSVFAILKYSVKCVLQVALGFAISSGLAILADYVFYVGMFVDLLFLSISGTFCHHAFEQYYLQHES